MRLDGTSTCAPRLRGARGQARRRRGRAAPRGRAPSLRWRPRAPSAVSAGRRRQRSRRRGATGVTSTARAGLGAPRSDSGRDPSRRRCSRDTRSGRRSPRAAAALVRARFQRLDPRRPGLAGTPRACREQAVAPRALVGRVGDELRREGVRETEAAKPRRHTSPLRRSRRLTAPGGRPPPQPGVTNGKRLPARDHDDLTRPTLGLRRHPSSQRDVVAAVDEESANSGPWVAGPPTSGGQMPVRKVSLMEGADGTTVALRRSRIIRGPDGHLR